MAIDGVTAAQSSALFEFFRLLLQLHHKHPLFHLAVRSATPASTLVAPSLTALRAALSHT
jgi:hypothetical protein